MPDSLSRPLPRQNVAVVGAFNPAIFQPEWTRRFVPEVAEDIETLMPIGGGPLLYQAGELLWSVTSERLVVHGPSARIGRFAAAVLRTLSHTPLRAAGVNFLRSGPFDRSRCGPWSLAAREDVAAWFAGDPSDFSIAQVIRRGDGVRLTVKLTWPSSEPEAILDLNYHREAEAPQGDKRAEELATHVERSTEFEADAERMLGALRHG